MTLNSFSPSITELLCAAAAAAIARGRETKGVFIATQLNSTQLDVELSTRSQREQLSPSMNVVTQLTQFVGRDVINK